jgi:hypothetical protein
MLGDVLVKVAACGITHTELDWSLWTCRAGHQRTSITASRPSPTEETTSSASATATPATSQRPRALELVLPTIGCPPFTGQTDQCGRHGHDSELPTRSPRTKL